MQPGLRSNYFRQQPFQGLPFTILDVQTWYYAQTSGHNHTKASHSFTILDVQTWCYAQTTFTSGRPTTSLPFTILDVQTPGHNQSKAPAPIHHSWCAKPDTMPKQQSLLATTILRPPSHHSWCANLVPCLHIHVSTQLFVGQWNKLLQWNPSAKDHPTTQANAILGEGLTHMEIIMKLLEGSCCFSKSMVLKGGGLSSGRSLIRVVFHLGFHCTRATTNLCKRRKIQKTNVVCLQ